MAFFFLTSIGGSVIDLAVDSAVSSKFAPQSIFKIESGKWIIKSDASTSQSVSQTLGLGASNTTHLVILIGGYYGRAAPTLWEWMASQSVTK